MPSEIPVASSFSKAAKGYDAARRALIPCYDAFYGAAITMISGWAVSSRPASAGDNPRACSR